jgi:signal transduction histidine kinase
MDESNDDAPPKPDRSEASYPSLISLAVHELRTPASVVGGYLRMLQRDADPLSERQQKMVDEAAKSCARIVDLIAELSDVGKLDSGSATITKRPLDFFALVQEVAEGMHEAEDRGVRLELRGPATGAPISGDPGRLGSAITAIFRAILREQPPGQTIIAERRLVVDTPPHSAALVVAEERSVRSAYDAPAALFDERRGGLGLMLPIARRVVEAHGGRLWSPASGDRDSAGKGAAIVVVPLEQSA